MSLGPNPKVIASGTGHTTNTRVYPEAASQSYKAGQLVYLSSGAVTACASDAVVILGIALQDATGTTGSDAPVEVIVPNTLLRIQCRDGSGFVTSDNATLGTAYGLVVVSNGCYLDTTDTTHDAFVVAAQEQDVTGYTNWAYVYVPSDVAQLSA